MLVSMLVFVVVGVVIYVDGDVGICVYDYVGSVVGIGIAVGVCVGVEFTRAIAFVSLLVLVYWLR